MIAGFIFLRLRGILGKKTGFEEDINSSFPYEAPTVKSKEHLNINTFDDNAKKEFLKGAKIAYETIITDFSDNDNKITNAKPLLNKNIFNAKSRIRILKIFFDDSRRIRILKKRFWAILFKLCFTQDYVIGLYMIGC